MFYQEHNALRSFDNMWMNIYDFFYSGKAIICACILTDSLGKYGHSVIPLYKRSIIPNDFTQLFAMNLFSSDRHFNCPTTFNIDQT